MSEPVPYRIYISPETIEDLNDAAEDVNKAATTLTPLTGNKVAAAIVTDCLQVWIALQKSAENHRADYLRQVLDAIQVSQGKRKPV